jgi:hypothetical protein
VKLVGNGTTTNRDAIGAKVRFRRSDSVVERTVMPTRSYLCQVELPVTLGDFDGAVVDITWPDGTSQSVPVVETERLFTILQP